VLAVQRVCLFGGSFNPVHLGHILMAMAAREACELDRVFFVPAACSPFKQDFELAPAQLRLRMLRLALAGQPHFELDPQELEGGGVSYSIETVRNYAHRFPGAALFYLIGADHIQQLPSWREAEELAEQVQFLVVPRPGRATAAPPDGFRLRTVSGFALELSSSQIRERVRSGLTVDPLVGPAVADVIRQKRLYL